MKPSAGPSGGPGAGPADGELERCWKQLSPSHPPPNAMPDRHGAAPGNPKLLTLKELLSGFSNCRLGRSHGGWFPPFFLPLPWFFSVLSLVVGARRVFPLCPSQALRGAAGSWLVFILSSPFGLLKFPFTFPLLGALRRGGDREAGGGGPHLVHSP